MWWAPSCPAFTHFGAQDLLPDCVCVPGPGPCSLSTSYTSRKHPLSQTLNNVSYLSCFIANSNMVLAKMPGSMQVAASWNGQSNWQSCEQAACTCKALTAACTGPHDVFNICRVQVPSEKLGGRGICDGKTREFKTKDSAVCISLSAQWEWNRLGWRLNKRIW